MKIDSDDFELFGLPRCFALERQAIDERWRALQAQVHPDRFAAEGAAAQRVAMQWAMRVNEAHRRLKDPVARATELCRLGGVAIDLHNNAAMPREFLMEQMNWRESLDDAADAAAVRVLESGVAQRRQALIEQLRVQLDERRDIHGAADTIRALMFVDRFLADLDARLETLEA